MFFFFLKQVLPFRYEWFDELSTEVVTFTFFALTANKFQPASNNPYLQLTTANNNDAAGKSNPDDEEDERETFLTMQNMPNTIEFDDDLNMNDEDYLLNGNAETVLDLIEHNYNLKNNINNNIKSQVIQYGNNLHQSVTSRKQQQQ
jgi:hypothetical protein